MDTKLVFAKTPIGDEAVRQSTRVVQRNLRMVLVQVDGKMSVGELTAKIGNPRLVESALRELEEGGFIAPTIEAVSVWEESKKAALAAEHSDMSVMSQFSTFGPKSVGAGGASNGDSIARNFSSFGKPVLPAASSSTGATLAPEVVDEDEKPISGRRLPVRRMSIARMLGLGGVAVLGIVGGTVLFYPYEQFKPAIEASASQLLQTPVKVDQVGVALWPSPSLRLSGVHVGEGPENVIAEIRIASPHSLLGKGPYQIPLANVSGADISASRLVAFPMFAGAVPEGSAVVVRKVVITQSRLALGGGVGLGDLNGELTFGTDGALEKATFETADRTLLIDALPGAQGLGLNIEGRAWQPVGVPVSFASLQAKGLLRGDKVLIQSIDTTFLGGILRGNWLLDWSNGLAMAGDGTLSHLDSRKATAALAPSLKLEGEMSGTIRLRSSGRDWDSLWSNVEAGLSTEITRGVFHGVDLGEAVRRSGTSEVRAGSTKFDRLRSSLSITSKQVVGRDVRMDAGMVTAVGQFVAGRNGQVDGNMSVTLQTSVSSQSAPVRIYGTLPDLSAAARK